MVGVWTVRGASMLVPWTFYGGLWFVKPPWWVHKLSMVGPWTVYGGSCGLHGGAMDRPWTAHGQCMAGSAWRVSMDYA